MLYFVRRTAQCFGRNFYPMSGRGLLSLLWLPLIVAESSSRWGEFSSLYLRGDSGFLYSWSIITAGAFVLVALVLSMFLIVEHLIVYNLPEEQKFLIGLILMVPVYAAESFLSLLDSKSAFNFEVMRDCYEAFALYCFERYLIACLVIYFPPREADAFAGDLLADQC